ncbi:unnamed protein product [Nezara viridula]|uniref:Neuropeptide n=1 Tax=Nezara viridula TaxID=85310 RepID=A0A9P0MNP6_NEZVI|nr:unnamed protein product [Nezara viridula]
MWWSRLVLLFTLYVFCITQSFASDEEILDDSKNEIYEKPIRNNHAKQCSVKTYCPEGHHCCSAATCCPDNVDCCADGLYCCDSNEEPTKPSINAMKPEIEGIEKGFL